MGRIGLGFGKLLACGLVATALGSTTNAAPVAGTTFTWSRPGVSRPEVIAGVLSAPSTRAPSAIARSFVDAGPDLLGGVAPSSLRELRVLPLTNGTVVKMQQTFRGLDVVGAEVAMRLDTSGRIRWAASSTQDIPADLSIDPTITADAALQAVLAGPAHRVLVGNLDASKQTKLVIWAMPNQAARLAYKVAIPRDLRVVETWIAYVDARTGTLIYAENLVKTDRQALVFEQNPVATPGVTQVQMTSLPMGATTLDGPDIRGRNCIDNGNCQPFDFGGMSFNIHMCDFEASAIADANGDFTSYVRPPTDLEPEDPFAEIQMYWHASTVLEYFRGFGFTNLNAQPMTVVANFRIPPLDISGLCTGPTSDGPLNPFDNAAYFPAGGLTAGFPAEDMLIFGQGSGADLAYEGDVVYHEMGHAVAGAVNNVGVAVLDQYGLDPTPGGMSEGYADWFAGTYTGDPSIGEYSGPTFGLPGPIRNMDNNATCPNSLWGEVHEDSLPWTGALWEIRSNLPEAQRPDFDQAIYNTFTTITAVDTMLSMRAKTVAELETSMGATVADAAAAVLTARGFDDCNNRVIDTAQVPVKDLIQLYGADQFGLSIVPGPVQFRLDVEEDATEITVNIAAAQVGGGLPGGGGGGPEVKLLVKAGDTPILWTATTHDAEKVADVTFGSGSTPSGEGTATGSFPAGVYHVMLANEGSGAFLQGISFSYAAGTLEPDAGVPEPDAGSPDASSTMVGGDGDGGCGCRASGSSRTSLLAPLLLLGAALILVRRRR